MLFLHEVTFEQRHEGCEGISHVAIWGKNLPGLVAAFVAGAEETRGALRSEVGKTELVLCRSHCEDFWNNTVTGAIARFEWTNSRFSFLKIIFYSCCHSFLKLFICIFFLFLKEMPPTFPAILVWW